MQLLSVALLSCLTSASVVLVANNTFACTESPLPSEGRDRSAESDAALASLRIEVEQLRTDLRKLELQPVRSIVSSPEPDRASIRAMVAEAMRQTPESEGGPDQVAKPTAQDSTTTQLLAALASATKEQVGDLWADIEAQGRIDEVLDVYRDAVAQAPQSIEARHELARATHAAAMSAPNHKNGRLWIESDEQYSRVLELDPQNWTARYEKAIKLAFWPDTYGRLPEAMGHFETLIEQQQNLPIEPTQAQVYIWLGNLHAQQGNTAKAKSIWQQGTQRHPTNERLRARLATLGG